MVIKNKVKELKTVDVDTFLSWEFNTLKDSKKRDTTKLENAIIKSGWSFPVIKWQNFVIDGTGRRQAVKNLLAKGYTINEIPYVEIEAENLEDAKAKALEVSSQFGEITKESFLEFTKDMELDFDTFEIDGMTSDAFIEVEEKDDEIPETPEEPKSKLGDLYELGEHRVLCGDSTSLEAVERLMDGKKADMVFTDPPYGMRLDTDYSKMGGSKTKYDKIIGDDADFDISFIFSILPSPIYYIWGAEYLYDTIPNFKQGSLVVWAKRQSEAENKVFGSAYELCWVFPKIKKEIWFIRGINQSSERLGEHPTQKPTELGVRAIKDRTEEGNLIGDLFLGSGSTLIASEKTGRLCYGMELDPKYVDVIVQRYVDYTGNENIKLNGKDIIWKKTPRKTE